jgi:hypothetical protein
MRKRPVGKAKMTQTLKNAIEQTMPGWTLEGQAAAANAADSVPERKSDFVGQDFAAVKKKYDIDSAGPENVDASDSGNSELVRLKSDKGQDDNVLGSRAALVIGGKIKAVQG